MSGTLLSILSYHAETVTTPVNDYELYAIQTIPTIESNETAQNAKTTGVNSLWHRIADKRYRSNRWRNVAEEVRQYNHDQK